MDMKLWWLLALLLCVKRSVLIQDATVPLVIWPGMGDSCCYDYGAAGFKRFIKSTIPGIYIKMVAFGNTPSEVSVLSILIEKSDTYNSFFLNANTQIELACQLLSTDPQLKDGFNAMGFSQGSQFLRALVQRCPTVKVYNLISVGGQHQGVYGFPNCPAEYIYFCHIFRRFLGLGTYLSFIQDYLVQAEYWHDPYDEESYQLDCIFLPDINQELKFNPLYKERLSKISNLILIKFEQDTMVQPKETQWFGFYKPGQSHDKYTLFESRIFQKDLLGLQYLYNSSRLHFLSFPGGHLQLTAQWFNKHLLKFINRTYSNINN